MSHPVPKGKELLGDGVVRLDHNSRSVHLLFTEPKGKAWRMAGRLALCTARLEGSFTLEMSAYVLLNRMPSQA